jgi:hypothetical protein
MQIRVLCGSGGGVILSRWPWPGSYERCMRLIMHHRKSCFQVIAKRARSALLFLAIQIFTKTRKRCLPLLCAYKWLRTGQAAAQADSLCAGGNGYHRGGRTRPQIYSPTHSPEAIRDWATCGHESCRRKVRSELLDFVSRPAWSDPLAPARVLPATDVRLDKRGLNLS